MWDNIPDNIWSIVGVQKTNWGITAEIPRFTRHVEHILSSEWLLTLQFQNNLSVYLPPYWPLESHIHGMIRNGKLQQRNIIYFDWDGRRIEGYADKFTELNAPQVFAYEYNPMYFFRDCQFLRQVIKNDDLVLGKKQWVYQLNYAACIAYASYLWWEIPDDTTFQWIWENLPILLHIAINQTLNRDIKKVASAGIPLLWHYSHRDRRISGINNCVAIPFVWSSGSDTLVKARFVTHYSEDFFGDLPIEDIPTCDEIGDVNNSLFDPKNGFYPVVIFRDSN